MAFCAKCGSQMAEGTTFCGSCGAPVAAAAAPAAPVVATSGGSGLADYVAGALAYVTIIPSILFLVMEPYNRNRFIRFHSFQNLFFTAAWIVFWIGLAIVHLVLALIPAIGWILSILLTILSVLVWLGGFALWIFLVYKAYNNEMFQLPFIGKLAAEQAAK